jgi:hypothetical protein
MTIMPSWLAVLVVVVAVDVFRGTFSSLHGFSSSLVLVLVDKEIAYTIHKL